VVSPPLPLPLPPSIFTLRLMLTSPANVSIPPPAAVAAAAAAAAAADDEDDDNFRSIPAGIDWRADQGDWILEEEVVEEEGEVEEEDEEEVVCVVDLG